MDVRIDQRYISRLESKLGKRTYREKIGSILVPRGGEGLGLTLVGAESVSVSHHETAAASGDVTRMDWKSRPLQAAAWKRRGLTMAA